MYNLYSYASTYTCAWSTYKYTIFYYERKREYKKESVHAGARVCGSRVVVHYSAQCSTRQKHKSNPTQ